MTKIKIEFKTGEVIRFLGCVVNFDNEKIVIVSGRYAFSYAFSDIKYFYIKRGHVKHEEKD